MAVLALNFSVDFKTYLGIYAIYLCYKDHSDQNVINSMNDSAFIMMSSF